MRSPTRRPALRTALPVMLLGLLACAGKNAGEVGVDPQPGLVGPVEDCEDCAVVRCGPDVCGGSCEPCPAGLRCVDGACVCSPDCTGKKCGDDGCGGSCGTCPDWSACTRIGLCRAASVAKPGPDLACACRCGRAGCATECGVCEEPSLACYDTGCGSFEGTPDCSSRECGPDDFGGTCGTCAPGFICTNASRCTRAPDDADGGVRATER